MEIREITDKNLWNSFLKDVEQTTLFTSWEWGEFERKIGSKYKSLAIFENEKVLGLLPIKTIKAKRGHYLHVRHGPIISWENSALVEKTVAFLKQKAKEENVGLIRISPLLKKTPENEGVLKKLGFVPANTHANDAELTLTINLEQSEQEILKNMRKNTRNLIRRAETLGIKVEITDNLTHSDEFMVIYNDTVARQKWHAYSEKYIKTEYEIFNQSKKAFIATAYYKNEAIASSIFIVSENQVIYHHSGSLTKYRNIPSAYLLHWEAIKYFKTLGLRTYNFWGVSPEGNTKHPWYGLSLFKRGFSSTELEFVHAQDMVVGLSGYFQRFYEGFEGWVRGYR